MSPIRDTISLVSDMGKTKTNRLYWPMIILAAVGVFALYFARMGSYPLVDPDEPVYGQVAKEMATGHGWLTPHLDGKMWFDKPPLFYWLSGASARLLGPTELACRLPSALLCIGVLLLLYMLVKFDFGKRAGLFAAIVMATCLQTIILARAAVTDMTLLFCLLGALYCYRRWFAAMESGERRTASIGWMCLCGVMTGLGMLAKGPVAPVLLFGTFFIHLLISRRLKLLLTWEALVGIAAALIVGLPWFVAMYMMHREAFVHQFIEVNNIARFTRPEHASQTGGWYSYFLNIPTLLIMFFPWSVFLPAGFMSVRRMNAGAKLAGVWFWVVFVFFSVSKTQLVTYIYPLYPAAALFVGVLFDRAASKESDSERSVRRGSIAALVFSLLIAVALVKVAHAKYPGVGAGVAGMGGVIVAASAVAVFSRARQAVVSIGTGMAVFALILVCAVVPSITSAISTRDILRTIGDTNGGRIVNLGMWKPSLLFYHGSNPETVDALTAKRMLSEKVATWVVCKDKDAPLIRKSDSVETARMGGFTVVANEAAAEWKGTSVK